MITKNTLTQLRAEIDAALIEVGKKHGVVLKAGSASYLRDGSSATFKLEVGSVTASGTVMTKEASAFIQMASYLKMKPEQLNQEFSFNGEQYILTGYNGRAPRFPFLAKRVADGCSFKLPSYAVQMAFGVPATDIHRTQHIPRTF